MVYLQCMAVSQAVTLQMVLLEIQDRSYRSTFQLLLTDVKEDVKSLKKDIDELKHSLKMFRTKLNTWKINPDEII